MPSFLCPQHLPGIPSAAEVAAHGVSMGEMQTRMMAKIEELTLHMIEQDKRAREQERRLDEQVARIASLEEENSALRKR